MHSYEDCIGAVEGVSNVKAVYFGSWQGTFLCSFDKDGQRWYVHDWYGSCSGCDAFHAEFPWESPTPEQAAAFGLTYVNSALTKEQMIAMLEKQPEWDDEAQEALAVMKGEIDWRIKR